MARSTPLGAVVDNAAADGTAARRTSFRFLTLHRDLWPGWESEADVLKVMGPEDCPMVNTVACPAEQAGVRPVTPSRPGRPRSSRLR